MSNSASSKNSVTPADVAAKAAEEKLVTANIPEQDSGSDVTPQPEVDDSTGEKKSLKDRLTDVAEKLKENKKVIVGLGVAAAGVAIVFVKYSAKKAAEALEENLDEGSTNTELFEETKKALGVTEEPVEAPAKKTKKSASA